MPMLLIIREEPTFVDKLLEGRDDALDLLRGRRDEILEVLIIIEEFGILDLFDL